MILKTVQVATGMYAVRHNHETLGTATKVDNTQWVCKTLTGPFTYVNTLHKEIALHLLTEMILKESGEVE